MQQFILSSSKFTHRFFNLSVPSILYAMLSLFCGILFSTSNTYAQSAVYVYKNAQTGKGEFMSVRSMPSKVEAEFLCQQKLSELTNDDLFMVKAASTENKGHGAVVMANLMLAKGKSVSIYGAALGQKTEQAAIKEAVNNLKKLNPEWRVGSYKIIQKFID